MKRLLAVVLLAVGVAACAPSPPPPVECQSVDCQQPPAQEWRDRLATEIAL